MMAAARSGDSSIGIANGLSEVKGVATKPGQMIETEMPLRRSLGRNPSP